LGGKFSRNGLARSLPVCIEEEKQKNVRTIPKKTTSALFSHIPFAILCSHKFTRSGADLGDHLIVNRIERPEVYDRLPRVEAEVK
jgi:hypothetical protein